MEQHTVFPAHAGGPATATRKVISRLPRARGRFSGTTRGQPTGKIFPMHVGVFPIYVQKVLWSCCLPHSSWGCFLAVEHHSCRTRFSRSRGDVVVGRFRTWPPFRLFPACGVRLLRSAGSCAPARFSHAKARRWASPRLSRSTSFSPPRAETDNGSCQRATPSLFTCAFFPAQSPASPTRPAPAPRLFHPRGGRNSDSWNSSSPSASSPHAEPGCSGLPGRAPPRHAFPRAAETRHARRLAALPQRKTAGLMKNAQFPPQSPSGRALSSASIPVPRPEPPSPRPSFFLSSPACPEKGLAPPADSV